MNFLASPNIIKQNLLFILFCLHSAFNLSKFYLVYYYFSEEPALGFVYIHYFSSL